jgi:hypothetical protein
MNGNFGSYAANDIYSTTNHPMIKEMSSIRQTVTTNCVSRFVDSKTRLHFKPHILYDVYAREWEEGEAMSVIDTPWLGFPVLQEIFPS